MSPVRVRSVVERHGRVACACCAASAARAREYSSILDAVLERRGEWTPEFLEEMLEWVHKHDGAALETAATTGKPPIFADLAANMMNL